MSSLIEVVDLKKHFPVGRSFFRRSKTTVKAVDGVNLTIKIGETLGLAGESGCGKTTLGQVILGLLTPTEGTVTFMGQNIFDLPTHEMKKIRCKMQIIFQDPFSSLNPRKTLGQIVGQPLRNFKGLVKNKIEEKILQLLEIVGLSPAEAFKSKYPHELSGGQRQRVAIARAISLDPIFVVADEPVSSLDLSIRAQILNLMKDLQNRFNLSYLFITHELGVLRSVCSRVVIMYLGKIVELGDVEDIFGRPFHPYTRALLEATPVPNPRLARKSERLILKGDVPSPINPPSGCRFHPRCPLRKQECELHEPELIDVGAEHYAACLRAT